VLDTDRAIYFWRNDLTALPFAGFNLSLGVFANIALCFAPTLHVRAGVIRRCGGDGVGSERYGTDLRVLTYHVTTVQLHIRLQYSHIKHEFIN
jgi:hypothetical protein